MKSDVKIDGDRLQVTRVFEAPRALVFSFWTKAEKLRRWSGCKEMIACEVVMDFRVGGSFTQKMQVAGKAGTCEFSLTGTYEEIVEPEKIVYQAHFGNFMTRVTVEFVEQGKAGTKVIITHTGCPDEFFQKNVSHGTAESLETLDGLVASEALQELDV